MQRLFFILSFFTLTTACFSQKDSTKIKFLFAPKNLRIRDELLGIQQINIQCLDKSTRGKVFYLSISEYKNGEVVRVDSSNASCGEEIMPINIGDRKVLMHINLCDKMRFSETDSVFILSLTGILKEDIFKMQVNYPGKTTSAQLKGNDRYLLTWVNSCNGSNEIKIPLNKKVPIITYAPPVKADTKLNSYCIRGEEDVEKWYDTFKIDHYYVFYLIVK